MVDIQDKYLPALYECPTLVSSVSRIIHDGLICNALALVKEKIVLMCSYRSDYECRKDRDLSIYK